MGALDLPCIGLTNVVLRDANLTDAKLPHSDLAVLNLYGTMLPGSSRSQ